jgi:hypothetical protein
VFALESGATTLVDVRPASLFAEGAVEGAVSGPGRLRLRPRSPCLRGGHRPRAPGVPAPSAQPLTRPAAPFDRATGAFDRVKQVNCEYYRPIQGWSPWQVARRVGYAAFGVFNGTEVRPPPPPNRRRQQRQRVRHPRSLPPKPCHMRTRPVRSVPPPAASPNAPCPPAPPAPQRSIQSSPWRSRRRWAGTGRGRWCCTAARAARWSPQLGSGRASRRGAPRATLARSVSVRAGLPPPASIGINSPPCVAARACSNSKPCQDRAANGRSRKRSLGLCTPPPPHHTEQLPGGGL